MCSHYQTLKEFDKLRRLYPGLTEPDDAWRPDMWPKYPGLFLRRPPELESGDEAVPPIEATVGRWGMIPPGTKPDKLQDAGKRSTFNARDDTVSKLWTYRHAWERAQHCLIPAEAFYEPDWRSGKAVATRFTAADGGLMMIAGLWDTYRDATGTLQLSYTMITINADTHPLLRHYHRSGDEKRMVVVLPAGAYDAWLDTPPEASREFLVHYPADRLVATPSAPADPT